MDNEVEEATQPVKLLCRLFVEKMQREQKELSDAIAHMAPEKLQNNWRLDIDKGQWIRQVPAGQPVSSKVPVLDIE